jgi:hypothetical protein
VSLSACEWWVIGLSLSGWEECGGCAEKVIVTEVRKKLLSDLMGVWCGAR